MQSATPQLADQQASLEATLKDEILRMYEELAHQPDGEFHFYHGRHAAELYAYDPELLDRAPPAAVESFAGVGNPHLRSALQPGETVLDLGSGAGLDAIIAAWQVGPTGKVIGVDLNPAMCGRARENAEISGTQLDCQEGRMEEIPVPDESVDVVISNGVINLSFQKRKVVQEVFRVLRPGGRISITDMVSAKQLKESIVNDPKLWAAWIGGALPEGEMFELLESAGFERVKSIVVPGFRFRKASTQNTAEGYGVKAVLFTAERPT